MKTISRSGTLRALLATMVLGLVALLGQAQNATSVLQKKFDALVERFDQAQKEYQSGLKAAKSNAERKKLRANRPSEKFFDEFKTLAKDAKGDDVGAQAWMRVAGLAVELDKKDDSLAALDTLMSEYLQSPALEGLPALVSRGLSRHLDAQKCDDTLLALADKSPHKPVQAAALLGYGTSILEDETASEDRQKAGHAALVRLQKDFADVKDKRGQVLAKLAEGALFEYDNLRIGRVAPDFEVVDENGVKFKLSDYRGKVVVIDFWGYW